MDFIAMQGVKRRKYFQAWLILALEYVKSVRNQHF